ncbi:MAG: SDR family oxidoreductase [Patulibacter sp.]|nr:SDR family oxidoreductase [Patulibacter sp.]
MSQQSRVLVGQVAAVTGGARGIGRATAAALVRQGMKVAIGDVDVALAERTAEELSAGGGTVRAYPLDVTDRASVRAFVEATEADLGPIDVFDNNAGIMPVGPFLAESDESTRRQLEVNVMGVVNCGKEILPRFVERRRGHLVNIASVAGKGGFPGAATYCGTKHFVVGWSEALRGEMIHADVPVDISCVMPAIVQTELATGLQATRGVKQITPEDVAEGIVDALRQPRFDVFVPKSAGVTNRIVGVLPRRGREGLMRALKADTALIEADHGARQAYELRAATSDAQLPAPAKAPELTSGE